MSMQPERLPVIGLVDNVDPDNAAQILALMSPRFDLKGVVVTGRAANDDRTAPLNEISNSDSELRTILNTVRMLNFMNTAKPGHDVPVFAGTAAPRTLVPHKLHVDELAFNDLEPGQLGAIKKKQLGRLGLSGDLEDARQFFGGSDVDEISLIVGGPMTDVAKLLRTPVVEEKARDIYAQFGMFGFGERQLMDFGDTPRGKRQFNVACDPSAAHEVLTGFRRAIHLYPTDVTRVDAIGFADNEALRNSLPNNNGVRALTSLYDTGYELMIKPRNEMIYVHDIAPALGILGLSGTTESPYQERAIQILNVPHSPSEEARFGEIDIAFTDEMVTNRYVAERVEPSCYLAALYSVMH
jgi:inosine-uridine nucleoside N-ribohydrolase